MEEDQREVFPGGVCVGVRVVDCTGHSCHRVHFCLKKLIPPSKLGIQTCTKLAQNRPIKSFPQL